MPSDHLSPAEASEDLKSIDQRYKTVLRDIELLKKDIASFKSDQESESQLEALRKKIDTL